jgi:hypothetical protein
VCLVAVALSVSLNLHDGVVGELVRPLWTPAVQPQRAVVLDCPKTHRLLVSRSIRDPQDHDITSDFDERKMG